MSNSCTEITGCSSLALRVGDLVEVKTREEILATLDTRGKLDGLPFMPEMLQYCGRQFRVFKAAHKTCDRVGTLGTYRRVERTVHLEGLRCDGQAHGGCEAGCLIFWKEAWLRKVSPGAGGKRGHGANCSAVCTVDDLQHATWRPAGTDGQRYSCQATEQLNFSTLLSPWDLRQYVRDLRSGNVTLKIMIRFFLVGLLNRIQRRRGGRRFPNIYGTQPKSPKQLLDLQPGELIQVKSLPEIRQTLHVDEHNRGLSFDKEMVKFCGHQARVLRRVTKIVDEKTGQMIHMKGDCIVLDGVACEGDYHGLCPRAIYPYWREIWLQRVEPSQVASPELDTEACARG